MTSSSPARTSVKAGGVFHAFDGIYDAFGPKRAVDTPISEQAIIGLGVGAAVSGLRPVVDLMFMDFVLVAMDQIVNQAAKLKYMFGGSATLPLTITTATGAGLSAAAQHSQSLEAMLCHVPGLKVVIPATPGDAKGLLLSCILDDNPTVFLLHKRMFGDRGPVPEERYQIPLGQAHLVRAGGNGSGSRRATIVTYGKMVSASVAAAEQLEGHRVDCDVIDLRTLQPLDMATVVESAKATNHVVVVHEAVRFGGLGAEIAAQIQEEAFDYLDAPVGRVGAPFAPVPFSPALEQHYVPTTEQIGTAVGDMFGPAILGG